MALTAVLVHERYRQPGGEDVAFEADAALLEAAGHRVVRFERHHDQIDAMGALDRARLAGRAVWSPRSAREFGRVLDEARPDVVHLHNTFPLLSPAVAVAAFRRGIPVVQTIQNLRLVCAQGLCTRNGAPCHQCLERASSLPALRHACYRGSRAQTAVVAAWQKSQRLVQHRWQPVTLFLPVSTYVRDRLVELGAVAPDRTTVRHNHVADPGLRSPYEDAGALVFAGRVVRDKGVETLVRAAARVRRAHVVVVGDGPDLTAMVTLAQRLDASNVSFTGRVPRPRVLAEVRRARCLVAPSVGEDPNPLSVIEAGALGVAVVGSTTGGIPEIVGDTGRLCPPGDVEALAAALADATDDRLGWIARGRAARLRYERHFSAPRAYETLLAAYRRAGVPGLEPRPAVAPDVSRASGRPAGPGPGVAAAR